MARVRDVIQRDTRANQPLATAVDVGTLYFVTDELVTERSDGTSWETYSGLGTGDVVGPAGATDNALARFDGATGLLLQDSLLTLGDTGVLGLPDGVKQTFNPDATNAGLNVGAQAGDPSAPADGDIWFNSTTNELRARVDGVSITLGPTLSNEFLLMGA